MPEESWRRRSWRGPQHLDAVCAKGTAHGEEENKFDIGDGDDTPDAVLVKCTVHCERRHEHSGTTLGSL